MTDLKNTPWTAQRDNSLSDYTGREHWEVLDSKGFTISQDISGENAKAIAALPDTLKELEAVKEELEVTNQALDQAIYKADKAQAENERLWEFVREFYQSDIGELKTITRLEVAAQELLKEKE